MKIMMTFVKYRQKTISLNLFHMCVVEGIYDFYVEESRDKGLTGPET